MDKKRWSEWYCGYSYLEIDKGGSNGGGTDVASLRKFPDGTCELWVYNTKDKDIWTRSGEKTTYHKTVKSAIELAEEKLGVKSIKPKN